MSTDRLELRRTLTQADFDRFAALSGDDNPIHVDPAFASRTRFGRTVSHGILLVSILRGLAERLAAGSALSRHEVRFPAPTFADEPMLFKVWREGDALAFACTREADGVVTCDGRFVGGGSGRMKLGDMAKVERRLSAADIAEYVALGGERPREGEVPDPLISALFSYLLGVKLPGPGANYLKQETDFLSAARVGEALTARVEVTRLRPEKALVDLATTCHGADGRLVATGRALLLAGDVA